MKPTVGRIVYYMSHGSKDGTYPSVERASIITAVHSDDVVDLAVFNPTGMFFNQRVQKDENGAGGTWDWMPYQKGQAQKVEEKEEQFRKTLEDNGIDPNKGI